MIKESMEERWLFLKQFIKKGRKIASLSPSSKALAVATCQHITPDKPQIILELGAGTGAITEVALQKMHPDSILYAVEYDLDLARYFRKRLPQANLLVCNAQDVLMHLHQRNITQVDVILSSLPLPSLSADVNIKIFNACQTLMGKKDIPFMQLTALPWVYYNMYKRLFNEVKFKFILQSLPPAGVYECRQFRINYLTQFASSN